jgi:hypothetical protein
MDPAARPATPRLPAGDGKGGKKDRGADERARADDLSSRLTGTRDVR